MTPLVLNNLFSKFERDENACVNCLRCSGTNYDKINGLGVCHDGYVWGAVLKKSQLANDHFVLSGIGINRSFLFQHKRNYQVPALALLDDDKLRCLSVLAVARYNGWDWAWRASQPSKASDGWRRYDEVAKCSGLDGEIAEMCMRRMRVPRYVESRYVSLPWRWVLAPRFRITPKGERILLPILKNDV